MKTEWYGNVIDNGAHIVIRRTDGTTGCRVHRTFRMTDDMRKEMARARTDAGQDRVLARWWKTLDGIGSFAANGGF